VALAFVPSSLVLGVTAFLTTDVAPVPLLWVVPLGLYLLTFVVAFSPGRAGTTLARAGALALPPLALLLAAVLATEPGWPLWVLLLVHLGASTAVAMSCHGALAADRPPPRHLTAFYGWVALGGAMGGAFNAVVAPLAFDAHVEYPLALLLGCLLWPGLTRLRERDRRLAVAAPALVAMGVAGVLVGGAVERASSAEPVLVRERNFFGVHRVEAGASALHRLLNGTTLHGAQVPGTVVPTTYYHPRSPIGQLVEEVRGRRTRRVAVIGLGAGTMACHARRGERWTFYEIDPKVERVARDRRLFTYLRDCPGAFDVVLGDGRLSLERAPPGAFGLVVADAFSSDAIPVHLVTREALALYRSRLAPGGVLAFHISNRYLDLDPVLGALAREAGLACRVGDVDRPGPFVRGEAASTWVAIARRMHDLGSLPGWRPCARDEEIEPWTDAHSNVFDVLRRGS
jgi:hypothetical protein